MKENVGNKKKKLFAHKIFVYNIEAPPDKQN